MIIEFGVLEYDNTSNLAINDDLPIEGISKTDYRLDAFAWLKSIMSETVTL